jgi:hypothetical protein
MENEFPPNSHSNKEARSARPSEKASSEPKVVARVTKSKAVLRKKPLRRKFIEAFRPEDNVGFLEHTLLDVLVPSIKDAVAEAASATIDNALGVGGTSRSRRRSRSGGSYTSYNRMGAARPRDRRDRDDDRRPHRRESRGPSDFGEIIIDTKVEAEEVLDSLIELISKYDVATMRDLLSLIGEPHNYTDEDWGWTDLRGARIHRIGRDGYLLDLPRPEALD